MVKEVETPEPTLQPETLIEPDKSQINRRAPLQLLATVLQHAQLNAQAARRMLMCVAVGVGWGWGGGRVEEQQEVSSARDKDAGRRFSQDGGAST